MIEISTRAMSLEPMRNFTEFSLLVNIPKVVNASYLKGSRCSTSMIAQHGVGKAHAVLHRLSNMVLRVRSLCSVDASSHLQGQKQGVFSLYVAYF